MQSKMNEHGFYELVIAPHELTALGLLITSRQLGAQHGDDDNRPPWFAPTRNIICYALPSPSLTYDGILEVQPGGFQSAGRRAKRVLPRLHGIPFKRSGLQRSFCSHFDLIQGRNERCTSRAESRGNGALFPLIREQSSPLPPGKPGSSRLGCETPSRPFCHEGRDGTYRFLPSFEPGCPPDGAHRRLPLLTACQSPGLASSLEDAGG